MKRNLIFKKAVHPVIATALLIVVAVVTLVLFNSWFQTYSSNLMADVEIQSSINSIPEIETVVGDFVYIKTSANLIIDRILVDGEECRVNVSMVERMQGVNISSCLNGLSSSTPKITLITDKNIVTESIYLKDVVGSSLESGILTLIYNLTNPNIYGTSADDSFGYSVSISGNYVLIGAPYENDAGGSASGAAYIYDITTENLLYNLTNPNIYGTSAWDNFGFSVSISGNYALISAPYEGDVDGTNSGVVYVYDITTGNLLHNLTNPNIYGTSTWDAFGYSISISGNYAFIGAPYEDDAGGVDSGVAYIYDITTGNLLYNLTNPNIYGTSADDRFGFSVSISGNYALIGAYSEDDAGGVDSGVAYIYDITTGNLLYNLTNPNIYDTSAHDWFGFSVSVSGNYAIIGAYSEDDAGGVDSGAAYIYDITTGNLLYNLTNPNIYGTSGGDWFGYSVSVSGNYALIGAPTEDDAGGSTNSGVVYVYDITTGNLLYNLTNPSIFGTSVGDLFGVSVSISGNYAIVGAYSEDDAGGSDSGAAYIYTLN